MGVYRYHQRDDAVLGFPELGMNDWSAFVSASLQIQAPAVRTRLIFQKKVCAVCYLPCSITQTPPFYSWICAKVQACSTFVWVKNA